MCLIETQARVLDNYLHYLLKDKGEVSNQECGLQPQPHTSPQGLQVLTPSCTEPLPQGGREDSF